ncbi:MAG: hypothetical protein GYA55_05055, partial [SAR324 cluster bacterium]|nr:hypothetical protein [SAR324 cluster bacterium]
RAFDAFDTFNWTYARFPEGKGPVRITAFIDKGIRIFLAQAVAVKRGSQVNWAVFKCHDCSNRILAGAAYFFVNGQKSCLKVTKREWEDAVYKVFGENFGEDKAVSSNNADEIYSKLFSY